jgi:serine/threonine protein kinase
MMKLRKSREEALSITKQIVEALEYAHERGIVHHDLKPANVKLTAEGKVKLLDFDLAKTLKNRSGKYGDASLQVGSFLPQLGERRWSTEPAPFSNPNVGDP